MAFKGKRIDACVSLSRSNKKEISQGGVHVLGKGDNGHHVLSLTGRGIIVGFKGGRHSLSQLGIVRWRFCFFIELNWGVQNSC